MKAQIVGMVVDVAKAQATVDALTTTIAGLDQQLADVQAQELAKGEQLNARKKILAERIRTAYDTDRTSLLETVLSSSDFTDVISEVGYQLDFAGQDKALAEQIVSDQKVLNVIHQTVVRHARPDEPAESAGDGPESGRRQAAQRPRRGRTPSS